MKTDEVTGTAWFSSARERRLWIWALVVLIGIYASLGFAPAVAGFLRDRGLLEGTFIFALLLATIAVIALGLSTKARPIEIAVAIGIASVYLMVLTRVALPEERTHLFEYGVLGALIYLALLERRSQGRRVPVPALLAMGLTAALGLLDESIQYLIPSRFYDIQDVGFNALAGFMAVLAVAALSWARRSATKRGQPEDLQ